MIAAVDTAGSQGFESAAKSLGLEVVSIGVVASGSGEPTVVFESLRK
jgi:hypothetical protein